MEGSRLHGFLLELTGVSGPLHDVATAREAPGAEDAECMLDFLSEQLVRIGYGVDFDRPNATGHKIEALIDVFNDLMPDDE